MNVRETSNSGSGAHSGAVESTGVTLEQFGLELPQNAQARNTRHRQVEEIADSHVHVPTHHAPRTTHHAPRIQITKITSTTDPAGLSAAVWAVRSGGGEASYLREILFSVYVFAAASPVGVVVGGGRWGQIDKSHISRRGGGDTGPYLSPLPLSSSRSARGGESPDGEGGRAGAVGAYM